MSQPEDEGRHVLYRHWGRDGQLLYVGMTNNPPARFRKHRSEADWWALVSWTTYEKFPSREALKAGETWAIQYENPECNIQERVYDAAPRQSAEPGTEQYRPITGSVDKSAIRLVHPLSRDFSVNGTKDAVRRAREWALSHRYYLLDSGYDCAHVFYLTRCPKFGNCLPHADHTQVWVPAPDFSNFERRSGAESPFILTQPYRKLKEGIHPDMIAYAAAHGLEAETHGFPHPWSVPYDDAWYYPGRCLPIRFTLCAEGRSHTVFPLEKEALSLMCAWRDDWPEKVPEWFA